VHRDIKPANVLCTKTGLLKLSDFGIARLAGDETLTATGEIVGTPAYMSPEQALGEKTIDGRSDLYSLGMLAYRLLAGANPYQSDNVATSLLRQTTGPSLQTADALPACPPVLERAIDGLLQKDRERRTQTAQAALETLRPLVDEVTALMPQLGAHLVSDPASTVRALFIDAAVAELREARAAMSSSAERAAIAAFRARTLAPEHPEAAHLVDEMASKHGLRFGPVDDPRVEAALAELATSPDAAAPLRRLANLYRGHKNPVLAARYLKRFLAVKPDDVVARQQLADLVGEHEVTAVIAAVTAPSRSTRMSSNAVSTQELLQGVRTGGMRAAPTGARATTALSATPQTSALASTPLSATPYRPPEAPRERSMPWALVLGVVVVALVVAVVSVRAFIRSGQQSLDRSLRQTDVTDHGMMNGLVAETQRPLLERGEASLRVGDFQGAIEAFNFALAADQDLSSPLAGRLFLRRAQANDGLGNARQALLDFRLAVTRLAAGSPERTEAESSVARLEKVAH